MVYYKISIRILVNIIFKCKLYLLFLGFVYDCFLIERFILVVLSSVNFKFWYYECLLWGI